MYNTVSPLQQTSVSWHCVEDTVALNTQAICYFYNMYRINNNAVCHIHSETPVTEYISISDDTVLHGHEHNYTRNTLSTQVNIRIQVLWLSLLQL